MDTAEKVFQACNKHNHEILTKLDAEEKLIQDKRAKCNKAIEEAAANHQEFMRKLKADIVALESKFPSILPTCPVEAFSPESVEQVIQVEFG